MADAHEAEVEHRITTRPRCVRRAPRALLAPFTSTSLPAAARKSLPMPNRRRGKDSVSIVPMMVRSRCCPIPLRWRANDLPGTGEVVGDHHAFVDHAFLFHPGAQPAAQRFMKVCGLLADDALALGRNSPRALRITIGGEQHVVAAGQFPAPRGSPMLWRVLLHSGPGITEADDQGISNVRRHGRRPVVRGCQAWPVRDHFGGRLHRVGLLASVAGRRRWGSSQRPERWRLAAGAASFFRHAHTGPPHRWGARRW